MVSIQRTGRLDAVLRCLEEEFDSETNSDVMSHENQFSLSELWVGSLYEIVRLIKQRALLQPTQSLETLAYDLRLLRIPIEKHEIAGDQRLAEPLILERHPPNNAAKDIQEYSKEDPLRSHIMPFAVSERGSAMWHAIDLKAKRAHWIERLSLSERALSVFSEDS